MPPPHVLTFQRFAAQIPNRQEASIAFGLFIKSEQMWADREGNPSDQAYRKYERALTEHEIARYAQEARDELADFGTKAVAAKRAEILQESLEQYESAARRGHRRFRGYGIWEAFLGALAWTLALILFWIVLRYGPGIDPVEVYHKVFGH
jgi:hypothetical protein